MLIIPIVFDVPHQRKSDSGLYRSRIVTRRLKKAPNWSIKSWPEVGKRRKGSFDIQSFVIVGL